MEKGDLAEKGRDGFQKLTLMSWLVNAWKAENRLIKKSYNINSSFQNCEQLANIIQIEHNS